MLRRVTAVVAGLALVVTAGCTPGGKHQTSSTVLTPHAATLTPAEVRYGAGFVKSSAVTYQPGVVMIGGGPSAIAGASSDGLVWDLHSNAPHVADLKVGSVLLATGFASGRVLALRHVGSITRVVLGPVELTDIIRDGHFDGSEPADLSHALAYSTPSQPGLVSNSGASSSIHTSAFVRGSGSTVPAVPTAVPSGLPSIPPLPIPTSAPPVSTEGKYQVLPFCCSGGIGVHFNYRSNVVDLAATLTLHVDKPTITFRLDFSSGTFTEASVQLHGAGGVAIKATGASKVGASGNVDGDRVQIPTSFDIPITGLPIPFTARLSQVFSLTTAFSATGAFSAEGDYTFGGDIGFGLHEGKFQTFGPSSLHTTTNPINAISNFSVGPAAIAVGYAVRLSVGIGALGFEASGWVQLEFGFGLGGQGALNSLNSYCRTVSFTVDLRFGIGYTIPAPVVALVNFFLDAFDAKPIQSHGDLVQTSPVRLVDKSQTVPAGHACV